MRSACRLLAAHPWSRPCLSLLHAPPRGGRPGLCTRRPWTAPGGRFQTLALLPGAPFPTLTRRGLLGPRAAPGENRPCRQAARGLRLPDVRSWPVPLAASLAVPCPASRCHDPAFPSPLQEGRWRPETARGRQAQAASCGVLPFSGSCCPFRSPPLVGLWRLERSPGGAVPLWFPERVACALWPWGRALQWTARQAGPVAPGPSQTQGGDGAARPTAVSPSLRAAFGTRRERRVLRRAPAHTVCVWCVCACVRCVSPRQTDGRVFLFCVRPFNCQSDPLDRFRSPRQRVQLAG